ncbi:MAG: hypothetical protein KIT09_16635 [Bryobacteraceae bacterium]|nr:hypothetical protein [Bryobacteraceae bacterium]
MVRMITTILMGAAMLSAQTINFDSAAAGSVPGGWSVAMTSKGGAPKWEVLRDGPENVLAQTSNDRTSGRFPLAVYDKVSTANGKVSVRFKPVSGQGDQAAGLVWRYRDANNYYVVRANALENNVVLYKVEGGRRSSLAPKGTAAGTYGVKHTVPSNAWSAVSVTFQGNLFTVSFDGKKLFEVEDGTFSGAGRVGLWTKADSVTYFDDFQIEAQ